MSSAVPPTAPTALGAPAAIPPAVARQAVEWLVELQSGRAAPQLRADWARWRAAHPDHERAWQRIESVNGRLRGLAAPVPAAIARATLAPRGTPGRRRAVQTLAVLFFAGGAAWMARDDAGWRAWTADLRTAHGERRHLRLDDGTALVLDTDSAVDLRFDAGTRRLRLRAGGILVTTAADPQPAPRPFLVETVQGEVRALGTRFTVRQRGDGHTVASVFHGAIELRPCGAGAPARVLQAGQQAVFTAQAIAPPQAADEDDAAWADGFLVARGMRLDDFLAALERYSPHALGCAPGVAGLRVSGSYPLADTGRVLDAVSATLGLEVQTRTRFWGRMVTGVRLAPRGAAG